MLRLKTRLLITR